MAATLRFASLSDEDALAALDRASWSTLMTPAPVPAPGKPFFDEKTFPQDVLVALVDDEVGGYIKLGRATPLPASDHVVHITGLVVGEAFRRQGAGRLLLEAAAEQARAQGARRLTLRVLGNNEGARRLYESAGFAVEGVFAGEFFLDGAYVDDVAMALDLTADIS